MSVIASFGDHALLMYKMIFRNNSFPYFFIISSTALMS